MPGGLMASLPQSDSEQGTTALLLRYGVPVAATAAALLATQVFRLSVFPTPLFFAAIVVSTWYGTVASGLLAVLLAILALGYYYLPTPLTLASALPHLLQFALPALLTCWFVAKRREAEVSLRAARDHLELKVEERTAELRQQIAEREKAEETVHRTQAQLAHVNRVMTMGELATSIAHELNQPLMAVVVNGDACQRWLDSSPPNLGEARAAMARMVSESGRASEIITRIRALSRNASAQKERVDLHGVITEILALVSGELSATGITVVTDLSHALPSVYGDRVQLQQVLLNLVVNAIDAMEVAAPGAEAGRATLGGARELRISTTVHGRDAVIVSVRDTGVGVPAEHADRIFDAFFTTKPDGVGMGLSISRTIVEAHAGRLWSEPAPSGAIFHLTLPTHA